ncbi:DNA cytosine methyltransferase [Treponema sp. HNW]|uniref:DNA cytosine methyltransferase n=1 Tax=Treponema sp. HNW TaxID=3116654 RepID=UPI003D14E767
MKYKYVDIFTGCGGLSLGFYNAGWKGLFAIEKNADAFKTLEYNLITKKQHFVWVDWLEKRNHDINKVLIDKEQELKDLSEKILLVVGGPPCQGFSMAGQRKKNDIRNKLVNSYIKFVKIVKPKYLFFENVYGFTIGFTDKNNEKSKPTSACIVEQLKSIGYNIDYEILDLSEYGIPQKRKRFILLGSLENDPKQFFQILKNQRQDFFEKKGLSCNASVKDAIGDLLYENGQIPCPDSNGFFSGLYKPALSKYQKYMRSGLEQENYPDSHRFAKHRYETIKLFETMQQECEHGKRLSTKNTNLKGFKRRGITILLADKPCNTITSHPDDYLHYSEPRILTVRECARVQSFPDWYEFKGKYTTGGALRKYDVPRYTQVGNAIPPLFAEQVGLALRKFIGGD